ncbi:MAG: recombinase family protein [Blautia faecis]
MNAGYVRLSRDDDKKNYVSVENQKLIISQYADDHGVKIDRWYEDDGISGYIFDRPGFRQMMADLDKEIDTVYVKDFSRLGRHNAKVLLLLDKFQERGKHRSSLMIIMILWIPVMTPLVSKPGLMKGM